MRLSLLFLVDLARFASGSGSGNGKLVPTTTSPRSDHVTNAPEPETRPPGTLSTVWSSFALRPLGFIQGLLGTLRARFTFGLGTQGTPATVAAGLCRVVQSLCRSSGRDISLVYQAMTPPGSVITYDQEEEIVYAIVMLTWNAQVLAGLCNATQQESVTMEPVVNFVNRYVYTLEQLQEVMATPGVGVYQITYNLAFARVAMEAHKWRDLRDRIQTAFPTTVTTGHVPMFPLDHELAVEQMGVIVAVYRKQFDDYSMLFREEAPKVLRVVEGPLMPGSVLVCVRRLKDLFSSNPCSAVIRNAKSPKGLAEATACIARMAGDIYGALSALDWSLSGMEARKTFAGAGAALRRMNADSGHWRQIAVEARGLARAMGFHIPPILAGDPIGVPEAALAAGPKSSYRTTTSVPLVSSTTTAAPTTVTTSTTARTTSATPTRSRRSDLAVIIRPTILKTTTKKPIFRTPTTKKTETSSAAPTKSTEMRSTASTTTLSTTHIATPSTTSTTRTTTTTTSTSASTSTSADVISTWRIAVTNTGVPVDSQASTSRRMGRPIRAVRTPHGSRRHPRTTTTTSGGGESALGHDTPSTTPLTNTIPVEGQGGVYFQPHLLEVPPPALVHYEVHHFHHYPWVPVPVPVPYYPSEPAAVNPAVLSPYAAPFVPDRIDPVGFEDRGANSGEASQTTSLQSCPHCGSSSSQSIVEHATTQEGLSSHAATPTPITTAPNTTKPPNASTRDPSNSYTGIDSWADAVEEEEEARLALQSALITVTTPT